MTNSTSTGRWLAAAVLSLVVSMCAITGTAKAAATNISLSISPVSIVADGTSTSTATATVTDSATGLGVAGDTVVFSGSPSVAVGSTVDARNGVYTATITSSTTVGSATITAADTSVTPNLASVPQTLTLTTGPVKTVAVALAPATIVADGIATTTATATVTDAQGRPLGNETGVVFTSTDSAQMIGATTNAGNGTYVATITSSTAVGTPTITASDGGVVGSAVLSQTVGPPASITLALSSSSVVADGSSTVTATATVKDAQGRALPSETGVRFFSSDVGDQVSATTNAGNGTYTATITSSTSTGAVTITAGDGVLVATQALTQSAGPPASMLVFLSPVTILAGGTSTTTAAAVLVDAQGHPISTDNVALSSIDPGQFFGAVTNNGNGTYSVVVRSSAIVGQATITARDGSITGSATLTQAAGPASVVLIASPAAAVTNEAVTLFASVGAAAGAPSGTITFTSRGQPIPGCVGERITPTSVAGACRTSFPASASPEQVTAVFTPDAASTLTAAAGALALTVRADSTSVVLSAPPSAVLGRKTTYTASVSAPIGRLGQVPPRGTVEFLDRGQPIPSCRQQAVAGARATCTLAYRAAGTHTITARYSGDPNFGGSLSTARTVKVGPPAVRVVGNVTATMQWLFYYTPTYTTVLVFKVDGASLSATTSVTCQGRGCPFERRSLRVAKVMRCGAKGRSLCPTGSIKLAAAFARRRLSVGTRITVVITRPNWIGKYYLFNIRARRGPAVTIACLAPGSLRPGVGCSR